VQKEEEERECSDKGEGALAASEKQGLDFVESDSHRRASELQKPVKLKPR